MRRVTSFQSWVKVRLMKIHKLKFADTNYLTAKCFIYEWTSSDNFKDYYKKLINTLEWLDDKNLNMDIAEKLIFTEFKKYILQYN